MNTRLNDNQLRPWHMLFGIFLFWDSVTDYLEVLLLLRKYYTLLSAINCMELFEILHGVIHIGAYWVKTSEV